jgi:predicted TPR repeat methyltransferase
MELGCGFGFMTEKLRKNGFSSVGIDISNIAIEKARHLHPSATFIASDINNFELLERFDSDVFIMAEITWYILDYLDEFINNIKQYSNKRNRPTYIIHTLTTYAPGIQAYGKEKFTNLNQILSYYNFEYLEHGEIKLSYMNDNNAQGTYFIAKV